MKRRKAHGGRRAGAGRPAISGEARTQQIPVKVSPTEMAAMRTGAAALGLTLSAYVRLLLRLD